MEYIKYTFIFGREECVYLETRTKDQRPTNVRNFLRSQRDFSRTIFFFRGVSMETGNVEKDELPKKYWVFLFRLFFWSFTQSVFHKCSIYRSLNNSCQSLLWNELQLTTFCTWKMRRGIFVSVYSSNRIFCRIINNIFSMVLSDVI